MAREIGVQYQVGSKPKTQKKYLIAPCLTLSIIRYVSKVKWSNPEEGVVPPTLHLSVVAIERGAFGWPETTVANVTTLLIAHVWPGKCSFSLYTFCRHLIILFLSGFFLGPDEMQVSSDRLSILANIMNIVIWVFSILPQIFSFISSPVRTVPCILTTTGTS